MPPCPHCGSTANGDRLGIEISEIYDGICYWSCLACGHRWHRFDPGTPRRKAIQALWDKWDEEDRTTKTELPT